MAFRLFGWGRADPEPAGGVAEAVASSRPVSPTPGPAAPGGNGVPVEADGAALEVNLRADLDTAVAELRALHRAEPEARDAGRLLDELSGNLAAEIRRPPLAAQQALAACRDPNASFAKILESFHQDPALTQSLLKHANSPFYAVGGVGCSSLVEAAQRVGLSGLHSVLMAATVEGLLCRPGGEYGAMVHQVWTHMVRTAPTARRLARVARLPLETGYTLGLLHDLGKLIVFDRLAAHRTASHQTARIGRAFLREVLARTHGPLGGLAALEWNLAPDAARAIATHPRDRRRYQDEVMSQVLAMAEWADITTVRQEARDYGALWARAGLTLDLDACQAELDEGR
jgi:HD-like signal output (HDOD) protein